MEVWKDIEGYDGYYQVSNLGRIKSLPRIDSMNRPVNGSITVIKNSNKYYRCALYKNGKQKSYLIHRLVAIHFVPNIYNKPDVNHKNGVKSDNTAENLEWVTKSENSKHAYDIGLSKKGEEHPYYGKFNGESNTAKLVIDYSNGIFYDSVREAAVAKDINYSTLSCKLCGKRKNNTSLSYI